MSKVKIIDKHSQKSIKCEREFLAKLHHPFIVNMNCAFQDYENLYLVMDLLIGGDLRYHICRIRKFTEEETKFFISCLLLGLEYIHNNNIIHRDIKPENLVSDENGYIRITDFGIAKINKKDNSSETSGTPGYMAPEVIMRHNHSFPADFFAIGVMGYELMLGTRPYNGKTRKEIKHQILKGQAKIDEDEVDWSPESVDFINKCLKRKKEKRLGYCDGIKELKNHKWFNGYDWEGLYNKKIIAPFIPKKEGNYDKQYCEINEELGTETLERYNNYYQKTNYGNLFEGYTYLNLDIIQYSYETYTRFTTISKQNKPSDVNASYSTNKKEIIKNNNFICCKNKHLNKNANLSANNCNNNSNLNAHSSSIVNLRNYLDGLKNLKRHIKPEINSPINNQAIKININNENSNINNDNTNNIYNDNSNDKIKKDKEKSNNTMNINRDISVNDINNKRKRRTLVKSFSIRNLIDNHQKGRKIKVDRNSSLLNLKGDNNILNNNNNDTNLSSLLSSNSIINFKNHSKINSRNNLQIKKEKNNNKNNNNIRILSIEDSTSKINTPNNVSILDKNNKNQENKNQENKSNFQKYNQKEKNNPKINKLCYNFSSKDLIGPCSDRNQAFSQRQKSNIKIKFKFDNSFNSSFFIIKSKNNSKNKDSIFNQKRELINKNQKIVQLKQINKENSRNLLPFCLPNLNKLNNNKNNLLNAFNCDEQEKKNIMNLSNLYHFIKYKKQKNEKFILINDKKQNDSKIKRSGSTLLFDISNNFEPNLNSILNKSYKNNNINKSKKKIRF